MLFKPALFLALVALTFARPSPSSLKTIASATGSKSSIKSPSQKLAEKNSSPSVASIVEIPLQSTSLNTQTVSQTENLSVNNLQGQDSDSALQYSKESNAKLKKVAYKSELENAQSVQNEVIRPSSYSNSEIIKNILTTQEQAPIVVIPVVDQPANVPVVNEKVMVAESKPISPVVVESLPQVPQSSPSVVEPSSSPVVVETVVAPKVESPVVSEPVVHQPVVNVVESKPVVPAVVEHPVVVNTPVVNEIVSSNVDAPIQPQVIPQSVPSVVAVEHKPIVTESIPVSSETVVHSPVVVPEQQSSPVVIENVVPVVEHKPVVEPVVPVVPVAPVVEHHSPSVPVVEHKPIVESQPIVEHKPEAVDLLPIESKSVEHHSPVIAEVPAVVEHKPVVPTVVEPAVVHQPEIVNSPIVPYVESIVNKPVVEKPVVIEPVVHQPAAVPVVESVKPAEIISEAVVVPSSPVVNENVVQSVPTSTVTK